MLWIQLARTSGAILFCPPTVKEAPRRKNRDQSQQEKGDKTMPGIADEHATDQHCGDHVIDEFHACNCRPVCLPGHNVPGQNVQRSRHSIVIMPDVGMRLQRENAWGRWFRGRCPRLRLALPLRGGSRNRQSPIANRQSPIANRQIVKSPIANRQIVKSPIANRQFRSHSTASAAHARGVWRSRGR